MPKNMLFLRCLKVSTQIETYQYDRSPWSYLATLQILFEFVVTKACALRYIPSKISWFCLVNCEHIRKLLWLLRQTSLCLVFSKPLVVLSTYKLLLYTWQLLDRGTTCLSMLSSVCKAQVHYKSYFEKNLALWKKSHLKFNFLYFRLISNPYKVSPWRNKPALKSSSLRSVHLKKRM